jgi:hypothetical protein
VNESFLSTLPDIPSLYSLISAPTPCPYLPEYAIERDTPIEKKEKTLSRKKVV